MYAVRQTDVYVCHHCELDTVCHRRQQFDVTVLCIAPDGECVALESVMRHITLL